MIKILSAIVAVAIVIGGVGYAVQQRFPEAQPQHAQQELLLAKLKDPSSAQLRNVRVRKGALCGEVNAKNAYGGYVGFRKFVVTQDNTVWIEDGDGNFSPDPWCKASLLDTP